ncbi:MAG: hypothetical protein WC941_10590 [Candidatus Bathyarchaeia archaeon]
MSPPKEEQFNDVLVATILEVLDFGDVVLNFLELNSPFKRKEIMKDPEILLAELRGLFGDSGVIIGDIIVKKVYAKLGIKPDSPAGSFGDRIRYAYTEFCGRRK